MSPSTAGMLRMKAAIVGAAETDIVGAIPDESAIQLHAEAAFNALADAGLTKDDVDGVLCAGQSPVQVAAVAASAEETPKLLPAVDGRVRSAAAARTGLIEIDLGNRRCIRVDAHVDPEALARVLDVLGRR